MSEVEIGSIEYLRSLVDSDSAIAIQCRNEFDLKARRSRENLSFGVKNV